MYGKCMGTMFKFILFNMLTIYDVNLMYGKVVELEEPYLCAKDHYYIHWVSFEKI